MGVTEHASKQWILTEPELKESATKLASESRAAYRDALLLEDLPHCRADCPAFLRRDFADKPSAYRLDSVLVLVKLEVEGWPVHI
jgi:hypothetical protein